jgi:hypothetical protein
MTGLTRWGRGGLAAPADLFLPTLAGKAGQSRQKADILEGPGTLWVSVQISHQRE